MKIFKKLFFWRAKKSSHDMPKAHIILGTYGEGNYIIECEFKEGYEEDLVHLFFLLNSGMLLETSVASLQKTVDDKEKLETMVNLLVEMLEEYFGASTKQSVDVSAPVVDPMHVFSQDNNDKQTN